MRLFRVNLPGVEVKDKRFSLFAVDGLQGIAGEPVWKQTEVAAAGNRYFPTQQNRGGNGVFEQTVGVLVSEAGRVGDAVGVVVNWKDGRIVGKTKFL